MKTSSETLAFPLARPVRDLHRWLLAALMLAVIALGWKYPMMGLLVPAAMLTGIAGSFRRGRYVCGNLCPRGSFFDTFFRLLGGTRPIPALLRRPAFRWALLALLMGFLTLQLARDPADPLHWGRVFWLMCVLTTAAGVALGLLFRPRAWCGICPVGTMAAAIGARRYRLRIAADCRACGLCEQGCPMGFAIAAHREAGALPHRDCLKCSACRAACPRGALSWPQAA